MTNKVIICAIICLISQDTELQKRWDEIGQGNTLAWAEHITGQDTDTRTTWDEFKSVAVIPGSSNKANGDPRHDDEVWVVVDRTIDGNDYTFIEQFQPLDWGDDQDYCWFVDCGGGDSIAKTVAEVPGVPGVSTNEYPTLQELTDAEIPDTPDCSEDTALVGEISVTTAKGLQSMTPGNHYSIDGDIDLIGVTWTPLDFDSSSPIVIEGNGNTISNLTIDAIGTNHDQALIGVWAGTGGGEIRNLNFVDCNVTGDRRTGILLGSISEGGAPDDFVIKNVNFTDCAVIIEEHAGGMLAGSIYSEGNVCICDCTVTTCTTISDLQQVHDVSLFIGIITGTSTAEKAMNIIDCHIVGGEILLTTNHAYAVGTFCGRIAGDGDIIDEIQISIYECTSSADIRTDIDAELDFETPQNISAITEAYPGVITMSVWPTGMANGDVVYIADVTGMEELNYDDNGGFVYTTYNCNSGAKTLSLKLFAIPVDTTLYGAYAGGGTLKVVTANNEYKFGGFVQYAANVRMVSCSMTGDLLFETNKSWAAGGMEYTGGFVGWALSGSLLIDCYSTGDMVFYDNDGNPGLEYVGNFIGVTNDQYSQLLRCYSTGDMVFQSNLGLTKSLGGFAGYIAGPQTGEPVVERCWSTSDLIFTGTLTLNSNQCIGGFAGNITAYLPSTVRNCYAWGSITMSEDIPNSPSPVDSAIWIGGFVGRSLYFSEASYSVDNCYVAQTDTAAGSGYTGQIPAGDETFGFGGDRIYGEQDSEGIFFDTETSSLPADDTGFGVGHLTEWMQTQANYEAAGWDFDTIWVLTEVTTPGTPAVPAYTVYSGYISDELCVYADGIPLGVFDVNSSDANDILGLDEDDYDVIIAGINYYSIYESFPLELANETNIQNVTIDFYESLGCNIGVSIPNSENWIFSQDDFATKLDLVTEIKDAPFMWGTKRDPVVYSWLWIPVPMTLRGIYVDLEIEEID